MPDAQTPTLAALLQDVVARGGSDLHLVHGIPPIARISGDLGSLPYPVLTSERILGLLDPYLEAPQKAQFKQELRLNFSRTLNETGRFRFAVYQSLGTIGATIRVIPSKVYPLSNLGLPSVVSTLCSRKSGIVFITGATGSGKSTTMAAMLENINQNSRPGKIITIEDPIETVFKPCRSVFVQREVGIDTPTFEIGTLDALRQDPDIICVGEMRDTKSIQAALLSAETGHLVFTTLHTRDASKTAQRIITAFQAADQEGLREQLAMTLEAVISQELLPRADGKGQVLACEVLIATSAVRQLIRENKLEAINDAIQSGSAVGMVSKDASVRTLYRKNIISREVALEHVRNREALDT